MRTITHGGVRLALVISEGDWKEGLSFFSDDDDAIQVGTWRYGEGKQLLPHNHNVVPRSISRTQEVVHILQGSLECVVYSEDDEPVERFRAQAGDTLVMLAGGHGYEILEEDTRVLEVKNGPYPGADLDRRRLGDG